MNNEINARMNKLDAEISALRRMVQQKPSPRQSWSQFDKEMVSERMVDIVNHLVMMMGRTRVSIKWEIYRQLRDQLL